MDCNTGWENGERVPIYRPPDAPAEILLLDALRQAGSHFPDEAGALRAIEAALDQAGIERAAEALGIMAARLEGTAAGIALRRVISGEDEPLRDAAERAGVSHVALWKHVQRIKKALGLTRPPLVEGIARCGPG
jgi:hypothetical protein